MTTQQLLDAFRDMTLLELSAFVREFEETFGVSAQAPAPQQAAPVPDQPQEEEQDEFDVILTGVGAKKIQVIKEVRTLTKLGLADAKAAVERLPFTVAEHVAKADAEKARAALEAAGAVVEVR